MISPFVFIQILTVIELRVVPVLFVYQVPSNKLSSAENSSLMLKFIDSQFPPHIVGCG